MRLKIVVFGLAITSSWGNGHAVTYRALIKALAARGHRVTFIERDVPWYRAHRDLESVRYCRVELYNELKEVPARFAPAVSEADLVVLGSFVPDGAILADWITTNARGVTAFYDIDTPVTLASLEAGFTDYISAPIIPRFDLYLSFTGGALLRSIEERYASPRARALHCAADLDVHTPVDLPQKWALGYLGTYSMGRQAALYQLLIEPARQLSHERFVVAGPQYPASIHWPANVMRVDHLPPHEHPTFYGQQRYTLNITRPEMVSAGSSPSVRLFEAASCGIPIISDRWPGLECFFTPEKEILIADTPGEVLQILSELPEERRRTIAAAARKRLLMTHTPQHRAKELEDYYQEVVMEDRSRIAAEVVA